MQFTYTEDKYKLIFKFYTNQYIIEIKIDKI